MTPRPVAVKPPIVGLAAVLLAGAVPPHTELEASFPEADAVLAESPPEVTLAFTTAVQLAPSQVSVRGPLSAGGPEGAGGDAADGPEVAAGELAQPAVAEETLVLPLPEPLTSGDYHVAWTTAGPDGHLIRGDFGFRVQLAPDEEPGGEAEGAGGSEGTNQGAGAGPDADGAAVAPDAAEARADQGAQPAGPTAFELLSGQVVRFLFYAGVLALLGVVAFRTLVLARADAAGLEKAASGAAHAFLWRIGAVGAVILLAAAPARLWLQAHTFFPGEAAAGLGTVLGGNWGAGWWIHCAAALLALTGLALARPAAAARAGASARGWTVVALGALLLPVAVLLSGHGIADEPRPVAAAATWLHVAAASAWVGGLGCLLFAGIPAALRHPDAGGAPPIVPVVGAFSRLARICVALLLMSGVVKAWLHLGSLSDLWGTAWGFALLVKGGWVAVVMLLGLVNWRVVRPALAADPNPKRLRRWTWWEFALGVMVVWVTAYLTGQPL